MTIPYWVQKTITGSLICLFCGSLVVQTGGTWFCNDAHCKKQHDLPAEEQTVSNYWFTQPLTLGTSASGVSGSQVVFSEIDSEGGEN